MTTIITAYRGETPIGRCNATCYNAKGKTCRCICGGRNHGVGPGQAKFNATNDHLQIVEELNRFYPLTPKATLKHHRWPSPQNTDT